MAGVGKFYVLRDAFSGDIAPEERVNHNMFHVIRNSQAA